MSIAKIIDTLQQQHKLYQQLLELEVSKKPLILVNDVVQLNVVTQKEKILTGQAELLEQNRMLMTARYFIDIGFRYRSGLLSDLIKSVSNSEEKQMLMDMHDTLTGVLLELKQVNSLNQQLIQQSLEFIDFSIDLMMDDPNEDVTYQHPMNQMSGYKRKMMYDSRA